MAQAWVATDYGSFDALELRDVAVPEPGPGEVTVEVRAAGMNPTDYKAVLRGGKREDLPLRLGHEVSGVVTALGPGAELASGGGAVGTEVLAFRIPGGYATSLTVPAKDVFAKPEMLGFPEAANLLLAGATAADMLRAAEVREGDTVVLHGASGAVGISFLQQAGLRGIRVLGTASERNFDEVRRFGGEPIPYGEGLEQRIRDVAPKGVVAAFDAVGTDEAIDVSLALVEDRKRIVSVAAFGRAESDGIVVLGGGMPESRRFRDSVRAELIDLARAGKLVVPIARTFPFEDARAALELLSTGHPGGKLALVR
ncbi:NADP-dependent oxidoreductase [Naasia sp. SYSU D00057]|uniref:NADP-dependent oxidoreductase n=1 Tax=Naasia sp. SYSU D00057 TaxID=2817380 RepID=UPI001B3079F0|nr:NADP-dependent oxidoreductase [Naasia sp. SYSU D00057]